MGRVTDSNFHIIDRGVIVLIGVITLTLLNRIKLRNKILSYLASYSISILMVFAYVWLSGFWEEQHSNAYRDIFLNFTVVYIVIVITIIIKDYINGKKKLDEL